MPLTATARQERRSKLIAWLWMMLPAIVQSPFCSGFERSIILEKCRNIAIGTNTIDYNPDYPGDRIDGISISDSSGCSVTGAIIESVRAGSAEQGGAIHVARSSEITIAGCQLFDPMHRGIHFESVRNSMISGCTVLARKPGGTLREAILARGCGSDVLIQGNLLGRGARGDVVVENGKPTVSATVSAA